VSWGSYAILIIFGAFVLLLILNPNISCFGKRIRSPLTPLFRKSRLKERAAKEAEKTAKKTEDYGFRLED